MDSLRFTHFHVTTINRLIILPHFSACWVFSCFHNPPHSDMDYRIFNVRTWYFLCHAYTCTRELGTPTTSQHNIFDSEICSQIVIAPLTGIEPRSIGSWVRPVTCRDGHQRFCGGTGDGIHARVKSSQLYISYIKRNVIVYVCMGDGVAQLVERRTRIQRTKVRIPSGAQGKLWTFPSQKCCADALSVCPILVCTRTHKNDDVRTIQIL